MKTTLFKTLALGMMLACRPAAAASAETAEGTVRAQVMAELAPLTGRIDTIEVYGIPVNAERRFSYEVQKSRWHLFIRFSSGQASGWAEMNIGEGKPGQTLEERAKRLMWFRQLKGLTPAEAVRFLFENRERLGHGELEAAEMATLDLSGRLLGKPAAEILTLAGKEPVPGLFCVLTDEPEQVKAEARRSLEQNFRTHLKVKLYGRTATDLAIVRAAREVMGPKAYLGGDVNMGYRQTLSDAPVDDIAEAMLALRAAGLDACEDPAQMSKAQWAALQRRVAPMALIPDVPMRPAWKSRLAIDPEMGGIYNMHPNCMGSLIETVELGRTIRHAGKKMMVGDSSLVGPACPAWQQVAIGLGADWVEAVEKPQENDVFQRCLRQSPVSRNQDGRFCLRECRPGFGTDIDQEKLKSLAAATLVL